VCDLGWIANLYIRRAAESQRKNKLDAVGLLPFGRIAIAVTAAEPILRTVAHSYSLYAIADSISLHPFLLQVRCLLIQYCENKTPDEIAHFKWLREAISAFLLLSENDAYLPGSVMEKVETLAVKHVAWKAVLQLYQHIFTIQKPASIANQLDSLIQWYAEDLCDASFTGVLEIIVYLYYGDTNIGLAEIRKKDALQFLVQHRRLVPIVYRYVKHSGVMEDRLRSLLNDYEVEEQVEKEEKSLASSAKDSPIEGSGAMFLPALLNNIWNAHPSEQLSKSTNLDVGEVQDLWKVILNAVTACSNPSVPSNRCRSATDDAKTKGSANIEGMNYLLACTDGMPKLQNWVQNNIMQA
jgi:hypothetical protein